ncbi:MAG: T9SS type A sorting domain-containing protein [Chitinophagaceae bacterium]|nr:T9SS type A sorting domain-containing protein [Chitinophagaceae bacterium]
MKTMKFSTLLLFFFCIVFHQQLNAQGLHYNASAVLDTGNITATINSNGLLFSKVSINAAGNTTNLLPGFEVPKGSNTHATFAADLWIGGLDDLGQLHVAASTYRQLGDDFFPGPIDQSGTAGDTGVWDQVWKVGKAEIQNHKNHYTDAGYTVPVNIASWPGNGPAGFDPIMAPFVDLNNNGIYEPASGDYPSIYGDQAVYFIFNDLALPHTETSTNALGLEVHGMAYTFSEETNPLLSNCILFNYTLKNKSTSNYHDVYMGLWNDFDLGCAGDDYVGTDVAKNSVFVINGDSIDGPNCAVNYQGIPPALSATWLSHPLSKTIGYHNDFTPLGNPENGADYYGYLHSTWKDDSPLAVDSLHPEGYGGVNLTDYYFPGFSDSSVSGQPSNWWWNAGLDPTDVRMVGSIGPMNLASQEVISLDFAYIYNPLNGADENGVGRLILSDVIQSVIDQYNNGTISSVSEPTVKVIDVSVAPNPFHDFTTISFKGSFDNIQVTDLTGRIVFQQSVSAQYSIRLNRDALSNGVYLVKLISQQQQLTTKILIQ